MPRVTLQDSGRATIQTISAPGFSNSPTTRSCRLPLEGPGRKGFLPREEGWPLPTQEPGPQAKAQSPSAPPPPKKKKQSLEDSLGQLPRGHFVLGLLAIRLNKLAQRGRKAHARPGLSHSLPLDALRRLLPFQLLPSRQELCSPVWRHPPNGRPPLSSCPRGHIYSAPGTQHGARAAGPHAR